jgi:hypothetical protein
MTVAQEVSTTVTQDVIMTVPQEVSTSVAAQDVIMTEIKSSEQEQSQVSTEIPSVNPEGAPNKDEPQ